MMQMLSMHRVGIAASQRTHPEEDSHVVGYPREWQENLTLHMSCKLQECFDSQIEDSIEGDR